MRTVLIAIVLSIVFPATAYAAGWCCDGVSLSDGSALEWCGPADDEAQAAGIAYEEWFWAGAFPDAEHVSCDLAPPMVVLGEDGSWTPEWPAEGAPDAEDIEAETFYQYYKCDVYCVHTMFPMSKHEYMREWAATEHQAAQQAIKLAERSRVRCRAPTWKVISATCAKEGGALVVP